MSPTTPDVTVLFPFPGELAARTPAPAATDAVAQRPAAPSATGIPEPSMETLAEHLELLNAELKNFGIQFEFSDADNRLITRVVDRETGELIRQIPSEEVLRMARSLAQTSGLLLQTSA